MLNYADILNQYAQAIQGTEQGYANLYSDVVGGLQGTEQSALTKEQRAFETGQGNILAGNVARGLGNSTIQGSMATGLLGRHAEAQGAIMSDFGQKLAAAKLQAGLAGLGYRGQAAQAYAGLGGQFAGQEAQTALGYAGLRNQLLAASIGRGGGGIQSEPQQRSGGGGGGYIPTAPASYPYGAREGYMGMGTSYGTSAPYGPAYGGGSPYLGGLSSGGDFEDLYGSSGGEY